MILLLLVLLSSPPVPPCPTAAPYPVTRTPSHPSARKLPSLTALSSAFWAPPSTAAPPSSAPTTVGSSSSSESLMAPQRPSSLSLSQTHPQTTAPPPSPTPTSKYSTVRQRKLPSSSTSLAAVASSAVLRSTLRSNSARSYLRGRYPKP
jgi:hypothetical protein